MSITTGYQRVCLRKSNATDQLGLNLEEAASNENGLAVSRSVAKPDSLAAMAGVFSDGVTFVEML